MIVVSDTTTVSALVRVERLWLLKGLFGNIIIPQAVYTELLELQHFGIDIQAIISADWIEVTEPAPCALLEELKVVLDPGEAEAIALAAERKADLLIMDEKAGRVKAAALNLPFTGLGGILIRAKKNALIPNVKTTLEEIRNKTGFFLTPAALRIILVAADEG
jgi:predicted nucleic acid-binding protein